MGNMLLIAAVDDVPLDEDEVRKAFRGIPGVYDMKERARGGFQAEVQYAGDLISVEFSPEPHGCIACSHVSDAALYFALEVQKRVSVPLRAFDFSCGFVIPLRGIRSLEEFDELIDREWDEDAPEEEDQPG
jgi:hypothetical protein